MKVFVTGGSSYLGEFLVSRLLSEGADVTVGVRSDAARRRVAACGARSVALDLDNYSTPHAKADVVMHAAGIRFAVQATKLIRDVGASRMVCVSSASVAVKDHPLSDTLIEHEQIILACGAETTIVRPTMIFGGARDKNIRILYRAVKRLAAVPRLVGGESVQPVFVDDLSAILAELAMSDSRRREAILTYGGPKPLSIGDIVSDLAAHLGRRIIPVPISVSALARLATQSRLGRRSRSVHALSMLLSARVAPDPQTLGFAYMPTEWSESLAIAITRYESRVRA